MDCDRRSGPLRENRKGPHVGSQPRESGSERRVPGSAAQGRLPHGRVHEDPQPLHHQRGTLEVGRGHGFHGQGGQYQGVQELQGRRAAVPPEVVQHQRRLEVGVASSKSWIRKESRSDRYHSVRAIARCVSCLMSSKERNSSFKINFSKLDFHFTHVFLQQ